MDDSEDAPFTTLQLGDELPVTFDGSDPSRQHSPSSLDAQHRVSQSMPSLGSTVASSRSTAAVNAGHALSSVSNNGLRSASTGCTTAKKYSFFSRKSSIISTMTEVSKTRPRDLPPKDHKEDLRHLKEYKKMQQQVKQKEQLEKEAYQNRVKQRERDMLKTGKVWELQILPHWDNVKNQNRTMELCWKGIPPRFRSFVWRAGLGNRLKITSGNFYLPYYIQTRIYTNDNGEIEAFQLCKERAQAALASRKTTNAGAVELLGRDETALLIASDVATTLPSLQIFQENGPYHLKARQVIEAFACYRPDIGYVQGLSHLVVILLLNMDDEHAFACLSNMLREGCLAIYYKRDWDKMQAYIDMLEQLILKYCPKLSAYMNEVNVRPHFLGVWIMPMFATSLPIDAVHRAWDLYCIGGDIILFQLTLGLLRHFEDSLLIGDSATLTNRLIEIPSKVTDFDEVVTTIRSITLEPHEYRALCKVSGCL